MDQSSSETRLKRRNFLGIAYVTFSSRYTKGESRRLSCAPQKPDIYKSVRANGNRVCFLGLFGIQNVLSDFFRQRIYHIGSVFPLCSPSSRVSTYRSWPGDVQAVAVEMRMRQPPSAPALQSLWPANPPRSWDHRSCPSRLRIGKIFSYCSHPESRASWNGQKLTSTGSMIRDAYTRLDKSENLYVRLDRRSGDNLLAHQYGRERRAVQQISRPSKHLHRDFLVGFGRKVVWVYNGQVGGVCRGYGYVSAREWRAKDRK